MTFTKERAADEASALTVAEAIDALGRLRARMADLAKEDDRLKARIAEAGAGAYEGALFRASVSTSERATPDEKLRERTRELVEKHLSPQFVSAHTARKTVTTVKVVARAP